MFTDKIVKGAGTHRILIALSREARTSHYLRRMVGAVNSMRKFDDEYMERIRIAGFVEVSDGLWRLTRRGRDKLKELGPIEAMATAAPRTKNFVATKELPPPALRPDAEDFRKWPSRRGNRLVYLDGRIEEIK